MRVVALISGGKDSCFNMMQCVAAGHEIVALANLKPIEKDELDSFMYQTVGHDGIELYAEAMDLPLYRGSIEGSSVQQGSDYSHDPSDEVEDLFNLLENIKTKENIEGVAVGAILSNYQRVRVENVCARLGLKALCYLWRRDQEELLEEMISCGVKAVLIKVAALGLDPAKFLGKELSQVQPHLIVLKSKYGINVCGEGGEYETFTLDCPLFVNSIKIEETEQVLHSDDPIAPVAYLRLKKLSLCEKKVAENIRERLDEFRVKTPTDFCESELRGSRKILQNPVNKARNFAYGMQNPVSVKLENNWVYVRAIQGKKTSSLSQTFQLLSESLKQSGSSTEKIICVNLFVRSMDEYLDLNKIYGENFSLNPPVRACVEIPLPETVSYVMEVIACPIMCPRKALHVQSISHWAPANIGPYSQAVEVGDLIFVSGQIGLIPGSMQLPENDNFAAECRLALRHANRVVEAVDPSLSLANSVQVICYLSDAAYIPEAKQLWTEACEDMEEIPHVPVTCVVVPRLPRNALVEWQVVVHRHSSQMKSKRTVRDFPDGLTCSVDLLQNENEKFFVCSAGKEVGTFSSGDWKLVEAEILSFAGDRAAVRLFSSLEKTDTLCETLPCTLIPVSGLEPKVQMAVLGFCL